ncbi:MAG: hypothetical protein LBE35_03875 [Clostridiales bacterium]|nr:hypothetical protein [Clostridiales bacterium]
MDCKREQIKRGVAHFRRPPEFCTARAISALDAESLVLWGIPAFAGMTFFVCFVPFVVKKIEPRKARKPTKTPFVQAVIAGLTRNPLPFAAPAKHEGIPAYQGNGGV